MTPHPPAGAPEDVVSRILQRAETLRYGRFAVGIEVLPDALVAVLTDPSGSVIAKRRRQWYLKGIEVEEAVRIIGTVAREMTNTVVGIDLPSRQVAIGVQIGGPVDSATGDLLAYFNDPTDSVYSAKGTPWKCPIALGPLIEDETGCDVVLENDAKAYTVYEQRFGAGIDTGSFAVILIRDGVGGGVVLDHELAGIPFEIGHIQVRADGRRCNCGAHGCIETLAGGRAIKAIVGELEGRPSDEDDLRAAMAWARDQKLGPDVVEVFRAGGEAIGHGIAITSMMFAVDRVVIYCDEAIAKAGPEDEAASAFIKGVHRFVVQTHPSFRKCGIQFKPWEVTTGAHGAALLALNRFFVVPLTPSGRTP